MNWTNKQQKVIEARNKNLLVSAAAGSGKTAVLVERIKKLIIEDRVDVRNFLVVTFTKAAAAEMKEKITKSISDAIIKYPEHGEYLIRQLDRVAGADISTFDSFAQSIVRNYYYAIDIEPGLVVCDENESALIKKEAMDVVFEEFFEEENSNFIRFLDAYSTTNSDEKLKLSLISFYDRVRTLPFGLNQLGDMIDRLDGGESDFFKTALGKTLMQNISDEIDNALMYFKNVHSIVSEYEDLNGIAGLALEDIEKVASLKEMDFDELQTAIQSLKYSKFKSNLKGPSYDAIKEKVEKRNRQKGKDVLKHLKNTYFSDSIHDKIAVVRETKKATETMNEILMRFDTTYSLMKMENGLMDFADGTFFAIKILENPEIAQEVRKKFKHIFIDEYQDSNYLQERLISLIKGSDNLFMVGDIKQSIYKFRMAEPQIFKDRYKEYADEDCSKNEKIDLNDNFRSKREIIDFVNAVFEDIMDGYDESAALHEGNEYTGNIHHKTELHIVDCHADEEENISEELAELKNKEVEALAAADIVESSLGMMIYDAKKGVERPLKKSDIAILMRSRNSGANEYYEALMRKGIDTYIVESEGYFDAVEVITILNLIKIIDNRKNDIELLSVLRSEIFDFDTDELIKIRVSSKKKSFYDALISYDEEEETVEKIHKTVNKLDEWGRKAEYMRLDEFVRTLLVESGYYIMSGTLPGGRQRQANLRLLIEKAKYISDSKAGNLREFLDFTQELSSKKLRAPQASISGEGDDTVKIMTVHHSKGLEYPMVLIGGIGHGFNIKKTLYPNLDMKLGVGLKHVDLSTGCYQKTILQELIEYKERKEALEEEIRVLYVACTRAKEKLVLVGSDKNLIKNRESFEEMKVFPNNYLEMIYPVVKRKNNACEIILHQRKNMGYMIPGLRDAENRQEKLVEVKEYKNKRTSALRNFVDERLSYSYPYDEENIKTKYSVSELNNAFSKNHTDYAKNIDLETVKFTEKSEFKVPDFIGTKGSTYGVDKGNLMHFVMQHIDFKKAGESVKSNGKYINEFIDSMISENKLTGEEGKLINRNQIKEFFSSDLGIKAASSENLQKEKAFTMLHEIEGKKVMVQGVIDCFFEYEGKLIIIDYKTNGNTYGIEETYSVQTAFYEKALESALGKAVDEVYLYLFSDGRALKVL